MDDHDEKNRIKQNVFHLFVRSGKSAAEVTNKQKIALDVLKLTTDRHEAPRGLSLAKLSTTSDRHGLKQTQSGFR